MQKLIQSHKNIHPEAGFSLMEILVTIAILAMTSLMVYQALTNSFNINDRLSRGHDIFLSLSTTTDALQKDIAQIYSPLFKESSSRVQNLTPTSFWSVPQQKTRLRRARFRGEKEKIYFISASKRRIHRESSEFELEKILWEIKEQEDGSYTLFRVSSKDIFDYEDTNKLEDKEAFPILERIREASFSFYNNNKETWEEAWDSESAYSKDNMRFPELIRLKIQLINAEDVEDTTSWEAIFRSTLDLNQEDSAVNAR